MAPSLPSSTPLLPPSCAPTDRPGSRGMSACPVPWQTPLAQDQAAAWPSQRFVRRGRNNVRVWNWARMHAHGHESGNVRHVHKKERANGLRGFGNALEIDDPRIGAGPGDDHLWLLRAGELLDFLVVDALVFLFHAIGY